MHISILTTDMEPSVLDHLAWDARLVESIDDIAKASGVPVGYVREALRPTDHVEESRIIGVNHPNVPSFEAYFTILGTYDGYLWGTVASRDKVVQEIRHRYKALSVIEDESLLSMNADCGYENVAILRTSSSLVVLVIGSVKGDDVQFDEKALAKLAGA